MDMSAAEVREDSLCAGHFPHPQSAQSTAHRLLVVDDNEDVLEIIQAMLHCDGYKVVALTDGRKALEIIETEEFDLVLTDLGMPSISGWEIAKKVKCKNPKLPVVMLTGWAIECQEDELSMEGIDMLLSKPLNWVQLTESVRKLLKHASVNT